MSGNVHSGYEGYELVGWLGHAEFALFLAGFALLWLAWVCAGARRIACGDLPWVWAFWACALAGAWHWQELVVHAFGPSPLQKAIEVSLVGIVPALYVEFARRSAGLGGLPGALLRPAWLVVAALVVLAYTQQAKETRALLGSIVAVSCVSLGIVAAYRSAKPSLHLGMRPFVSMALLFTWHGGYGSLHDAHLCAAEMVSTGSPPVFAIVEWVLTAFVAALAAFDIGRSLRETTKVRYVWAWPITVAVVLAAGWAMVVGAGYATDRAFRAEMQSAVLAAVAGIDPRLVEALPGEPVDVKRPEYREIKHALIGLLSVQQQARYAWIMAFREGRVEFLVDAEPESCEDASLPGDEYEMPSPALLHTLKTGEPVVSGPYGDVWGVWMTAFAPVLLPGKARPVGILGLDIAAPVWVRATAQGRLAAILFVFLVCVATAMAGAAHQRIMEASRAEHRHQYETLVQSSPNAVALLDPQGKVVMSNQRLTEWLGGSGSLEGVPFLDLWTGDALDTVADGFDRAVEGAACNVEVSVEAGNERRHLSLNYRPLLSPEGHVEGLLCVGSDITDLVRAQERLREQSGFLQQLLDTIPHLILAKDTEGRVTCCNYAAARFLARDVSEVLGQNIQDLFPEAVLRELPSSDSAAALCASTKEIDFPAADGAIRTLHFTTRPYTDSEGRPVGCVGVGLDITERKRIERDLQESEQRLRAMAEAAMDGVVVMDEEGKITYWNAAAERIFGYGREEVLGKEVHPLLAPDRYESLYSPKLREFQTSGKGAAIGRVNELHARRKDGSEFPIELTVSAYQLGDRKYAVGIVRDTTERKRSEAERQLLAETIRQSEQGVLIVDRDQRIVYHNSAFLKLVGYEDSSVTLTGEHLADCVAAYPHPVPTEALQRSIAEEREQHECCYVSSPDGGSRFFDAHAFPVQGPSGTADHFVCLYRDITRERKLETELRLSQKLTAIGQLASGIAHEINTPIQYVADNTRFLQSAFGRIVEVFRDAGLETKESNLDLPTVERIIEALRNLDFPFLTTEIPQAIDEALEGLQRVAQIVRAMREFSHPGGTESVPTDVNACVSTTLTVSRNTWKYAAEMRTELEPNLPQISCVPGDLNQIVLNLVLNAAQAIEARLASGQGRKGCIRVHTFTSDGKVHLLVSDDGCGIPEEIAERIYDPFFTTKEVGKGTGQGLWIVRSLVEKHGGDIRFESRVGEGTSFIVSFPAGLESSEEAA